MEGKDGQSRDLMLRKPRPCQWSVPNMRQSYKELQCSSLTDEHLEMRGDRNSPFGTNFHGPSTRSSAQSSPVESECTSPMTPKITVAQRGCATCPRWHCVHNGPGTKRQFSLAPDPFPMVGRWESRDGGKGGTCF